jgi:acetyltransferase-like isoleucine patch superfamily enzyme
MDMNSDTACMMGYTATAGHPTPKEMNRCVLGRLILRLYAWKRARKLCLAALERFEGEGMFSMTLRRILDEYHGVEVGAYSYGQCMVPGSWPAGVRVGRYVSVGPGVRVFLRNHPMDRLSTHPFFYNRKCGMVPVDTISTSRLEIEHDAWIGANVIVTSNCDRIGIGAVIGAGSIVTKDVPDFAVVVGNPARILRYRFPEDTQKEILKSKWWEQPISTCIAVLPAMTTPVTDTKKHPLLQ